MQTKIETSPKGFYETDRFEDIEFVGAPLKDGPFLRFKMPDESWITVPGNEETMRHLAVVLSSAYGPDVMQNFRGHGWIK